MSFLKNLRIASRLRILTGALLAFLAIVAAVALFEMQSLQANLHSVAVDDAAKNAAFRSITDSLATVESKLLEGAGDTNAADAARLTQELDETLKQLDQRIPKARQMSVLPENIKLLESLRSHFTDYEKAVLKASDLAVHDKTEESGAVTLKEVMPHQLPMAVAAAQLVVNRVKTAADSAEAAEASANVGNFVVTALSLSTLLLGIFATFFIVRSIVRPLERALSVSKDVARGNLDVDVGEVGRDEVGQVLAALDEAASTVRRFVDALRDMKVQHDAGHISAVVPPQDFQGGYSAAAERTN